MMTKKSSFFKPNYMKCWLRNTGHVVNANYSINGCEVKKNCAVCG